MFRMPFLLKKTKIPGTKPGKRITHPDLERDPPQNESFGATKLTQQTPAPAVYRSGQVRPGQVRSGQVRSGQVRSGQVRSGNVVSIYIYICIHRTYIDYLYIYIYIHIIIYIYIILYIIYIIVKLGIGLMLFYGATIVNFCIPGPGCAKGRT